VIDNRLVSRMMSSKQTRSWRILVVLSVSTILASVLFTPDESMIITEKVEELVASSFAASEWWKSESEHFIHTPTITFSSTCDPCAPGCLTHSSDLAEFQGLKHLCVGRKEPNVRPAEWATSPHKFVLLTMLEPPKKTMEFETLKNTIKLLNSADLYFPYKADYLILFDFASELELRFLHRVSHRTVVFVNVTNEFAPIPERNNYYLKHRTACHGDYSYRAMCRFASGPIFWMDFTKDYDYFVRMDEDAYFQRKVPTDLVSNLKAMNAGYGYALEQTSSSQCRIGMNNTIVKFINEVDHDAYGRPWVRLGNFKFFHQMPNNKFDIVDVKEITKKPLYPHASKTHGSVNIAEDLVAITYYTYNCNFEIADLKYFRHPHYRLFFKYFDDSGSYFSTRMGDHEVKTLYLELFAERQKIGCYPDLPYFHHSINNEWCVYNNPVYMFPNVLSKKARK